MNSANELRKYKELLDSGIITEEEFQEKKNSLLSPISEHSTEPLQSENTKSRRNPNTKKLVLVFAGILLALGIFLAFGSLGKLGSERKLEKAYISAVTEAITPIMNEYDIDKFEVEYEDKIYCKDFSKLSDKNKFNLLYEIHTTYGIDHPIEEEDDISLASADIYVSERGYYYLVNSLQVSVLGNYDTAGLYYSDGGGLRLVYAADFW